MKLVSLQQRGLRRDEMGMVRRMIAGEEEAFEEFSDHFIPLLYRFAQRRLAGNPDLTQDIVQSTVCKAIAKLSTFRGKAALSTWLCAVCKNEIAGHFRRSGRSAGDVDFDKLEKTSPEAVTGRQLENPEQAAIRKEAIELVHQALDELPPHYGQALEWKYLEDLSVNDIAERMSLRPKAAESLLTRARQSFRDGFNQLVTAAQPSPEVRRLVGRRMEFGS